jgi:hypothetical protein
MEPTQPSIQGVKRPGREADQLCPPSAEMKTGGAIPPLPNKSSWRGDYLIEHRDKLFLLFTHFVDQSLLFVTRETGRAGGVSW